MTGTEIGEFRDTIVSLHNRNGISIKGCLPLTDALVNEGYRKETNTAEEIFAEVERELTEHGISITDSGIAAVKEKYTAGRSTSDG